MSNSAHPVSESRWLVAAAALAAVALAPSAAHAASKLVNAKSVTDGKAACAVAAPAQASISRAILGGAPSALDRIRADQQGLEASKPAAAVSAAGRRDPLPVREAMEPASRTPIAFVSAETCGGASTFSPIAETDATAELGTRAIPVKRTRFDARWNRVRAAAPAGLMQAKLRRANAAPGLSEPELLARVNQWVNREIAYVGDDRNYRQRDFWATAEQTIARGKGDCEDFAILKMQMLRAAGIDPERMKLVLLRDLAANADHAFLLVETDAGKLVLDNVTDRLYDGSRANAVRPVLSFSGNRRWVHAYRGTQPSPNLAAIPASEKSYTLALNNQRSVSADPLTFKTGFSK
ncbi:transglutaminase-like cysteine peptidase [Sphingopyxis sp.]|uniref:transglutaminase-like cysteine peptidase n=1 Tax=Sphingopyxis sp. TaxID=1908224 RepID=UPI002D79E426|nr:transglutaminase-like cysteine peptidase [Sphingopyxis sp.]HET6525353.1 transglutaminase-like cysteine peptidase [Sphingopyxis sp.]